MGRVWQKAEAGWYRTPVDKDGELWVHLRHDGRRFGWSVYVSDDRFSYRKSDLRYSALLDLLEAKIAGSEIIHNLCRGLKQDAKPPPHQASTP